MKYSTQYSAVKWGTVKGMVHMITMLTYIAQIDIGEYKNPFKCPETTLVTLFWLLFVP